MIEHIDYKQIPEGFSIHDNRLFDQNNKYVGKVPHKEYESQDEYLKDLEEDGVNERYLKLWSEFNTEKFPETKWKIKNLIPYEGFVIIASPSGEKKTWVAMEMARCIATGEDFLGNSDFKTECSPVLYVDQEMSKTELQHRGKLLRLHETKSPIYLYKPDNLNLSKDEDVDDLSSIIEENGIKVVFIDTLRAVAGGLKEDRAEDVRAFFDKFKKFKDKGIIIVFIDHCRKPTHFEGKIPKKEQLLGSQDKTASIESLIMIRSEERSNEIRVYQNKNRNGVEHDPFKIEMKDEVDDTVNATKVTLRYAGKADDKEYAINEAENFVVNFLSENEKGLRKEIIEAARSEKKFGEKNISQALRNLDNKGRISYKKVGRENEYFLKKEADKEETLLDKESDSF